MTDDQLEPIKRSKETTKKDFDTQVTTATQQQHKKNNN